MAKWGTIKPDTFAGVPGANELNRRWQEYTASDRFKNDVARDKAATIIVNFGVALFSVSFWLAMVLFAGFLITL